MPTTKTTAPAPADADPGIALLEAVAHQREVERRLVDGEAVTAAEHADAEHAVHLAEARVAAAATRQAEEAEAAKQAAIDTVVSDLTNGHLGDQAARIVARYDEAVGALAALHAEAAGYVEGIRVAANQLLAVDRAALTRRHDQRGELRIDRGNELITLADGRRFNYRHSAPIALIAEAAGQVVDLVALANINSPNIRHQRTVSGLRDVAAADPRGAHVVTHRDDEETA